jgi:hypothetical protein
MKKKLNEGTVIKYIILIPISGSDFLTSYGTVPVPLVKKLRFLRFRFYNADTEPCSRHLNDLMMILGWTPSSTKGLHCLRNSPARMTTLVVPSPTSAS